MPLKPKNKGLTAADRIKILSGIATDDDLEPTIRVNAIKALDNMTDSEGMASSFLLEIGINKRSMIRYLRGLGIEKDEIIKVLTTDDAISVLRKTESCPTSGYLTTSAEQLSEEDELVKITDEFDKREEKSIEDAEQAAIKAIEDAEIQREKEIANKIEKERKDQIEKLMRMDEAEKIEEARIRKLEEANKINQFESALSGKPIAKDKKEPKKEKKLFDEDFL